MSSLAVIILTKNEEAYIEGAIQNAKACTDEVIIVDSGSTDKTLELAKANGAKVCFRQWDNDFAAQRNFALAQTTADWVLFLDADERMDDTMCAQVRQIVADNDYGLYGMTRQVFFSGHRFKYGIFKPDVVYRMFPRTQGQWVGKVHEHIESVAPKKVLQGIVDHYTYSSWHQWLQKADHYTSIWAEEQYKKGKRTSLGKAYSHVALGGFKAFFLKAAFLDGWMGLFSTYQHMFYTMLKYVKLYEQQIQNKEGK